MKQLPRLLVGINTRNRGQEGVGNSSHQSAQKPGQYIAAAAHRQGRMTAGNHCRRRFFLAHHGAGALKHPNDFANVVDGQGTQRLQGRQTIGLYLGRGKTQNSRRFFGMGRADQKSFLERGQANLWLNRPRPAKRPRQRRRANPHRLQLLKAPSPLPFRWRSPACRAQRRRPRKMKKAPLVRPGEAASAVSVSGNCPQSVPKVRPGH